MADYNQNVEQLKVVGINKTCDLGSFIFEDCQNYEGKTELEIIQMTKLNYCLYLKEMFDLRRSQREKHGENGEVLEYTKALYNVEIPESSIVLPREKPIPK